MSQHPLLSTPAVLIMSLIGVGAAIFVGVKHEDNKLFATNEASRIQAENDQNLGFLNNVTKIEGRRITALDDKFITLDNGKQIENIEGGWTDCKVGDKIVDYDAGSEEIVCSRVNNGRTTYHRNYYPGIYSAYWRGSAPTSAIDIENYKNDKLKLKNNGFNFDADNNKYTAPNGTVFQVDPKDPSKITQNVDGVRSKNKGTIKSLKGGKSGNGGISTGKGSGAS